MLNIIISTRNKNHLLNVFRYDDISLRQIFSDPHRANDLFYKYSRNLSNGVNRSLDSFDLPFFLQTKTNARGCVSRRGFAYPSAPCPSLPCSPSRRHLPCQKLFPLEIYRSGENRGVISGRTKQRAPCRLVSLLVRRIIGALFYRLSF